MGKKNEAKPKKREPNADEDLLVDIIAAFVSYPDDIGVTTLSQGGANILIELEVNRADYGKVAGSQGRHITAIRTIFDFIGAREQRRIRVMLIDQPRIAPRDFVIPPQFEENLNWKPDATVALLQRLLDRIFIKPFSIEVASAEATTNIEIRVDKKEQEIMDALKPHLQPIFHACGKASGRILYVEAPQAIPAMTT
jgi:predicted RNA-binding protein YlqC (UPF0109 family)